MNSEKNCHFHFLPIGEPFGAICVQFSSEDSGVIIEPFSGMSTPGKS